MLLCDDKSIYTGITNNLKKRLVAHKSGLGGAYTRSHKVKKFIYSEKHRSRSKALKREIEIKKLKHSQKLLLAAYK